MDMAEDLIEKMIQKIGDGAWVKVKRPAEDEIELPIEFVLGDMIRIKDNYVVYYSTMPEGLHDFHESLVNKIHEIDNHSISYNDQYGRAIVITGIEPFEDDKRKEFKNWQKEMLKFKDRYPEFIEERLANPKWFLEGV